MRKVTVITGAVAVVLVLAAVTTTLALTLRPQTKPATNTTHPRPPPAPAVIMVPQPTSVPRNSLGNSTTAAERVYPSYIVPMVPYVHDPIRAPPKVASKPSPPKGTPSAPKGTPSPPKGTPPQPKGTPPSNPVQAGTILAVSPTMFASGQRPWGTLKLKGGEKLSWPAANQLKVTFPAGGCASDGGILGYATPPGLLPARAVTFGYRIFFPDTYDFRSGGKLPGLKVGAGAASGGDWSPGAATFRVMWRTDGAATAYVYYAKPESADPNSVADQVPAYAKIAVPTGTAGHSVWQEGKVADALPRFKRGAWNDVSIAIRVNSPGQADGLMAMTVNGVSKSFGQMKWLLGTGDVQSIALDSWFGGSASDCDKWAPKTPQVLVFSKFVLRRDG